MSKIFKETNLAIFYTMEVFVVPENLIEKSIVFTNISCKIYYNPQKKQFEYGRVKKGNYDPMYSNKCRRCHKIFLNQHFKIKKNGKMYRTCQKCLYTESNSRRETQ